MASEADQAALDRGDTVPLPPQSQTRTVLVVGGRRTLLEADATRAEIFEQIGRASGDVILLDCEAVTEADLSFLQIVIAARRSAAAAGRTLKLTRPASGVVAATLVQAGLAHSSGRHGWFDPFWAGGESEQ